MTNHTLENLQDRMNRFLKAKGIDLELSKPTCQNCHGFGGFRPTYTARGAFWGFVEYCDCEIGKLKQTEAIANQERIRIEERNARIDEVYLDSKIPERFKAFTWDQSPLTNVQQAIVKQAAIVGDCIYLYGSPGTGKTGAAILYMTEWITANNGYKWPLFITVPEMMSKIRSTYNRNSDDVESVLVDKFGRADLLVLDDLGAEHSKTGEHRQDVLHQILGHRHEAKLPTVFTSNIFISHLAVPNKLGDRLTSRIVEMCTAERVLKIEGIDQRLKDLGKQ